MQQIATITSKKQLTIPVEVFRKARLEIGQRVWVSEENGNLKITPAESIVDQLAGSVPMPKKWLDKNIDEIIEVAKNEHFSKKYNLK